MKTIMIDMDEVLADIVSGIHVFSDGEFCLFTEREELFDKWLPMYTEAGGFRFQPKLSRSEELVSYLVDGYKSNRFNLCILTSVRDFFKPKSAIVYQKKQWLEEKFPELAEIPFCTTSSGRDKSILAHANAFLIDDHKTNIRAFEERGGYGVVYDPNTFDHCINMIEEFLKIEINMENNE